MSQASEYPVHKTWSHKSNTAYDNFITKKSKVSRR